MEMKKVELIKRLFTHEEIIAIDNRNRELEEENKKLREENEKLKNENISLHIELEEIKDDGELSYEEKLLYD